MRIKDWIYQEIKKPVNEIPALLEALESIENLDKEKCIAFIKEVIVSTQNVYLEAVSDTLALVEQVDRNFLHKEIPSHLK